VVKDKVFKKQFASELFRIAQNDLQAAKTLNADALVRKETAMLMIQQCVEKSLKALLCSVEAGIPQTHDLSLIVDRIRLASINIPTIVANTDFEDLTPFATLHRYEDGNFEISEEDMQQAIELATIIIDWVTKELQP
jgi:HEPN domain-containing protein